MNRSFGILCVCIMLFSACSIQKMAFNKVANALAPSYSEKEKEAKRQEKLKEKGVEVADPMLAFLGEEDIELVAQSFPIIIKMYEMMMLQNREHEGLARMTGEFYVMYANAFVESPAVYLPDSAYDTKNEAFLRAKKLYLRGRSLILASLDLSYPGFGDCMNSSDEEKIDKMLSRCRAKDVESLFWAGAASLAAFALEPLNAQMTLFVYAGHAMLERAGELSPSFNNGSIWEVLTKFYAGAPESLGGGMDKAEVAYQRALQYSGGASPSLYVTFATAFCIPKQDGKGFDEALESALSIDAKASPENTLMFTISQAYARWLKNHKEDFILGE